MKSSWAYRNGLSEMKKIKEQFRVPLKGWLEFGKDINGEILYCYAERRKSDKNKIDIKTYTNKKQALKKIEVLKSEGVNCFLRLKYPFLILCKDYTNWTFIK